MSYHPDHDVLSDIFLDAWAMLDVLLPDSSSRLMPAESPYAALGRAARAVRLLRTDPLGTEYLRFPWFPPGFFQEEVEADFQRYGSRALEGLTAFTETALSSSNVSETDSVTVRDMLDRVTNLIRRLPDAEYAPEVEALDDWLDDLYETKQEISVLTSLHSAAIFDSAQEAADYGTDSL